MPARLLEESLRDRIGQEVSARLVGEPEARPHGVLTREIHRILERADPSRETYRDLETSLKKMFGSNVVVTGVDAIQDQQVGNTRFIRHRGDQLVFADPVASRATALITQLDQPRMQPIIDGLEMAIHKREKSGDYWPEGRLNLGIAYAAMGNHQEAIRWLEDAVNMLKYPSYIPRSEHIAA